MQAAKGSRRVGRECSLVTKAAKGIEEIVWYIALSISATQAAKAHRRGGAWYIMFGVPQ